MNMMLAVASGGAIGALLRYYSHLGITHLWDDGFPWATFLVNVFGSFLLGVCVVVFSSFEHLQSELRVFLMIGLLGAFTTFSIFSLDAFILWERGEIMSMVGYIAASVFFSIGGLFAGIFLMRQVLA